MVTTERPSVQSALLTLLALVACGQPEPASTPTPDEFEIPVFYGLEVPTGFEPLGSQLAGDFQVRDPMPLQGNGFRLSSPPEADSFVERLVTELALRGQEVGADAVLATAVVPCQRRTATCLNGAPLRRAEGR